MQYQAKTKHKQSKKFLQIAAEQHEKSETQTKAEQILPQMEKLQGA